MDLSKILKFETIVLCPLFGPKEKKNERSSPVSGINNCNSFSSTISFEFPEILYLSLLQMESVSHFPLTMEFLRRLFVNH